LSIRITQERKRWDAEQAALAQQKKDDAAKKFWSQKWNQIAHVSPSDEIAFDDIGLPERQRDIPRRELFELCQQFKIELEKRGYELLHAGKFEKYLSVQYERGRDLTLDAFKKCFARLMALGALSEQEIDATKVQPEAVPEIESHPTLDDLERLDLSTREGAAKGRQIAEQLAFNGDRKVRFQEWLRSVEQNFGVYLSEEDQKVVIDFFLEHGLNFLRHEDYNITRRALSKKGDWPSTLVRQGIAPADKLLTSDEKLAEVVSQTDWTHSSFDEQAALKNKIRQQVVFTQS